MRNEENDSLASHSRATSYTAFDNVIYVGKLKFQKLLIPKNHNVGSVKIVFDKYEIFLPPFVILTFCFFF